MIGCLMAIFHLTQAFMHILCRLPDGLGEQFIGHEMRAGAGCQKAAILQQLHGAQVDFAIALNRIFHGASGLCKGRRIKNDYIEFSALCFESGQQCKHILALKFHNLLQAIELGILRCLIHRKLACINPQAHFFAPAMPAFSAKEPVWVKQSNTSIP